MKHICRLTGEKKEFKNNEEYDKSMKAIGALVRNRTRQARPNVSRVFVSRAPSTPSVMREVVTRKSYTPDVLRPEVPMPKNHVTQKFSLIHPSRGRVDQAYDCMKYWYGMMSPFNEVEYILSIDHNDPSNYLKILEEDTEPFGFRLVRGKNANVVQALNRGAKCATGDVLIYVSDDFLCPPNWDLEIQKNAEGDDWFMLVNDGIQKKFATILIESRKYYKRLGYMYYPEYISMFADPDATEMARAHGRLQDRTNLLFKHNHYTVGGMPFDATYSNENSPVAWKHGEKLFEKRKKENFGVKI